MCVHPDNGHKKYERAHVMFVKKYRKATEGILKTAAEAIGLVDPVASNATPEDKVAWDAAKDAAVQKEWGRLGPDGPWFELLHDDHHAYDHLKFYWAWTTITIENTVTFLLARRDQARRDELGHVSWTWRVEVDRNNCEVFTHALALRKHLTLAHWFRRLDPEALKQDRAAPMSSCWTSHHAAALDVDGLLDTNASEGESLDAPDSSDEA